MSPAGGAASSFREQPPAFVEQPATTPDQSPLDFERLVDEVIATLEERLTIERESLGL